MKNRYCSEPFIQMKGVNDVKGYWLGADLWKGKHSEATLFYIHGGGYVSSSPLMGIQALCYLLETLRTKYGKHIRAFAVEYSLAPENQFPKGLNDVERAYQWLASSDIPGSRNVFLCGDSAGGTMALALLQKLYSENNFMEKSILPLGSILISPWVEASCESLSYVTNSKYDTISSYFCQLAVENYIFGKEGRSNVTERRNTLTIIDWLNKVETNLDFYNDGEDFNEKNNRKSNSSIFNRDNNNGKRSSINIKSEWMHEVVQVKTHSGEGISTGRYRRSSRRSSQSSRRVRNNSLEIHIQSDLDSTKNVKRVSTNETFASNPFENPLISPLRIPKNILAKFPPLFISYGGKEIFRDDIEKFCKKCIESKKTDINNEEIQSHPDVIIEVDEGMIHNYPILLNVFGKRSKNALSRMVDFLNTHIPNVQSSSILRCNSSTVINDLPTTNNSPTTTNFSSVTTNTTNRFSTYSIIKEVKNRFSSDNIITEILNRFDTDSIISDSFITEVDSETENIDRISVNVEKMVPLVDSERLSSVSTDSSTTLQPLRPVYMPSQSIRPIVSPNQPIYPSIRSTISSLQPIQSSYYPMRNSLFLPGRRFSQFSRLSQYGTTNNRTSVQFRTNIITPNDNSSGQILTTKETKSILKRSTIPNTKSTINKCPKKVIEANSRTISFNPPSPRLPWRSRVFVGTDLSGNEYYESVTATNGRTRRIVEMKEKKLLSDYEEDALPVQWQSWLRHTRYDPPTIDEIELANKRRETIIQKAKAFDKEWEEVRKKLKYIVIRVINK
ncbi:10720_t:CDS:2 [Diversispora eburnea]|uniref:10720_t:CDS:1 n=1 Tax=Diversispora eburnea TaxID=1213867 RepID=A0A9N8V095_9GLOM|nr:10720_t:CDS:2 [Diversispora eburnea]